MADGGVGWLWRVQVRQRLKGLLCDVVDVYAHSLSLQELYSSVLLTHVPETQRDGLQLESVTGHTKEYVLARALFSVLYRTEMPMTV